jgi:hypothetical protein
VRVKDECHRRPGRPGAVPALSTTMAAVNPEGVHALIKPLAADAKVTHTEVAP